MNYIFLPFSYKYFVFKLLTISVHLLLISFSTQNYRSIMSRNSSRTGIFAYSKMEVEDPEEVKHRRAQFMIYKTMQQVDSMTTRRSRPSWLKVKTFKLKIRIGKKLKKLRKTILCTINSAAQPTAAAALVYKQLLTQFRTLRRLFPTREAIDNVALFPPIFT